MASRPPDAKQVFLDALEEPEARRAAFVAEACAGDATLERHVRELLEAHDDPGELLARSELGGLGDARPGIGALLGLRAGMQIGHYTLSSELGEGGFGTVWVAEQREPVRRRVALKVLKPMAISPDALERFHAERRLLARMQHEGIATLFDGGTTEAGLPWFAMELIDGQPVTGYCRERELSLEARLELFMRICQAIQHAHQKGVVHRDLKPSNVLVAEVDGRPVPKVIDFGIAKLTAEDDEEQALQTRTGLVLGTPAYLSPEQVDDASDVDTRVDVYSLGVLLYELLCDLRPIDEETLRSASLSEVLRLIREVEPPRPSERLAAEALGGAGAERGRLEARARRVRGDLDWITMRCLEKDRERRYASVAVLAGDLERHLSGEPVLAGPPNLSYRLRKFAARHRGAFAAGVAFALLLITATAVSSALALRARRAETEATREAERATRAELDALAQAAAADAARGEADAEAARARTELAKYEEIALFLQDILLSIDPAVAQGRDRALLHEILDRAARRIDGLGGSQPGVEATLRHTIGQAYFALALFEPAEPQLRRALELFRETAGAEAPRTLTVQNDLGGLLGNTSRFEEALELLERTHDARTRILGPEHEDTLLVLNNLATVRKHSGDLRAAEAVHRELLELHERIGGPDARGTITAVNNLAGVLDDLGEREEALDLFLRALDSQERVNGPTHPRTLIAHNNVGLGLRRLGRLEEAELHLLAALEIKREILEPGHPSILISLNNLAGLYGDLGRPIEAEDAFLEAVELAVERLGEGDERTHGMRLNYGVFLVEQGRPAEAEGVLLDAEAGFLSLVGEDDPRLGSVRNALATVRKQLDPDG